MSAELDTKERIISKARYQRARAGREYNRAKREEGLVAQLALEHARNAESCANALIKLAQKFA